MWRVLAVSIVFLSGCSSWPEGSLLGGGRVTSSSANQILGHEIESLSEVDLILLLNPDSSVRRAKPATYKKYLNEALRVANDGGESRRSEIQDYFILASNQRCNLYLAYMKRLSVYNNGVFGTLTTVLGGAGAIVTNESSARLLSGLAGISSGTRAELNQAIFESVATSVIVPGIKDVRKSRLEEILRKRTQGIEEYTVEGAIADAIDYHGDCNMDAGIARAQKSLQLYSDIGIGNFNSTLEALSSARLASESFSLSNSPLTILAKNEIDNIKTRIELLKDKVDSSNSTLKEEIEEYVEKISKDGEIEQKAVALDKELQTLLITFTSSTGHKKSIYAEQLSVQQNKVITLVESVQLKEKELNYKTNGK